MKKMMFVVLAVATLCVGCGKEERVVEQSPSGFNEIQVNEIQVNPIEVEEIQVEHIYTENVITENVITENVVTENVITWDNSPNIQYWDD